MKQYIVDAFTNELFKGNQAAVCVLEKWFSDEMMLNIAQENNFLKQPFSSNQAQAMIYAGSHQPVKLIFAVMQLWRRAL